jgi:hypothetical protein
MRRREARRLECVQPDADRLAACPGPHDFALVQRAGYGRGAVHRCGRCAGLASEEGRRLLAAPLAEAVRA